MEIQLVIIFTRIDVRPEKRKEVSQTLHAIVKQVRKENGCLHSDVYQNFENGDDYLVVSEWEAQKDSDDYLRSDIFTVLKGTACLLHRPPEIVIHTVDHSKKLEA